MYNKLRKLEEDIGKLIGLYNAIKSEKVTLGEGIEINLDGNIKAIAKVKAQKILNEIKQIIMELEGYVRLD